MKKTQLLVLPLLLLCSCSSYDEAELIKRSMASIDKIEETTDIKTYSAKAEGHVLNFKKFFIDENDKKSIPSLELEDSGYVYGSSYALGAPIRLSKNSYYPKEGTDDSQYSYSTLSYILNGNGDNLHHLEFEDKDDSLCFFVNNVSKELNIGKVDTDPEGPTLKKMKLYARFNITLNYDKKGFLMDELIETVNVDTAAQDKSVSYHVTYAYQK